MNPKKNLTFQRLEGKGPLTGHRQLTTDHSALLPLVERPGRYLGIEVNARKKDWSQTDLKVCFIFPDLYEIGMSNLGLQILYNILNNISWALADRAYCPDRDMEEFLREKGMPLWGLESGKPLNEFDILAFTLPYELCYSNILTILDLAAIPFRSEQRKQGRFPLIIGGGTGSANPEPVAEFFDAIFIGEGDEAIKEIAETTRDLKKRKAQKKDSLNALSKIKGMYVPSLYEPYYEDNGFKALKIREGAPPKIIKRIVPDLSTVPFPQSPIVPYVQSVHDRLGVEITRGCTRGCRFCQAGFFYRPVRERRPEEIINFIEKGIKATGWDELSLLSLSTGDYSLLSPLLCRIMAKYQGRHISVSLPSIRVGTLSDEVVEFIQMGRKTGFTLAPEAGSERLRKVINKVISEEALLEAAKKIFSSGWTGIKLYFMTGLPTETMEDILAMGELSKEVLNVGKKLNRRAMVTMSVGTFIPKVHTPFQWERQIGINEAKERIFSIKSAIKDEKRIRLKWNRPEISFLEGVFSRGDRRLSSLIEKAWRKGTRLDAWSDHARPETYAEAALDIDLDLDRFLMERDEDSRLPWDHISTGVGKKFLKEERKKAFEGAFTPDCRTGDCQTCGVCDFKTVFPITCDKKKESTCEIKKLLPKPSPPNVFSYHLIFTKLFEARFLGHLELMRSMHRAIRRAGVPVFYSKGHHPMPKVSFGDPIPLGVESICEHAVLKLEEEWEEGEIITSLNRELPQGICLKEVRRQIGKKLSDPCLQPAYLIFIPFIEKRQLHDAIKDFKVASYWEINIERKGKVFPIDLKKQLQDISTVSLDKFMDDPWAMAWIEDLKQKGQSLLTLKLSQSQGRKPKVLEILSSIFKKPQRELLSSRILKISI